MKDNMKRFSNFFFLDDWKLLGAYIVIRNGTIVWKHGPYCWYFRLNLKHLENISKEPKMMAFLLGENNFEAVLTTFCCYDYRATLLFFPYIKEKWVSDIDLSSNYLLHIMLTISKVFTILCLLCLCGNREYPGSFQNKSVSSFFKWVSKYILFMVKKKAFLE